MPLTSTFDRRGKPCRRLRSCWNRFECWRTCCRRITARPRTRCRRRLRQIPLWQLEPQVQEEPLGRRRKLRSRMPIRCRRQCRRRRSWMGQKPRFSQKVPQSVPGQVSVSPAPVILYSTSRFASAPVFDAQVEPVRRIDCRRRACGKGHYDGSAVRPVGARSEHQVLSLGAVREAKHRARAPRAGWRLGRGRDAQDGDGLVDRNLSAGPCPAQVAGEERRKDHSGIGVGVGARRTLGSRWACRAYWAWRTRLAAWPIGPGVPGWPVGPIGPIGPIGPDGPGVPCGPCVPGAPLAPAAPAGPVGPIGPCKPAAPGGPVAPVDPVAPVSPFGPAGPAAPVDPCVP